MNYLATRLVTDPELPAELFHDRLIRLGRIQFDLELHVQLPNAQRAKAHWAQHLDIADRIEPELSWHPVLHHVEQRVGDALRLLPLDEVEI